MASSSNPTPPYISSQIQDLNYLYASIANVSNFVSVKLASDRNYHLWKTQMLCLMKTHNMVGLVDDTIVGPTASTNEIIDQYDSLLKGWIFGSVTENVLAAVVDLVSAKDVWDNLKSFYDATISSQQDLAGTKQEAKLETKDIDGITAEAKPDVKDTITIDVNETETKTEGLDKEILEALLEHTLNGNFYEAEFILGKNKDTARVAIRDDGSTILHLAVASGHKDFLKELVSYIKDEDYVLERRSSDGSTALHIAAIVGNRYAAHLLVEKNKELLQIEDHNGRQPLHKAYENMHLDTIAYLFKASDDGNLGDTAHPDPGVELGVDLVINAIFAKEYSLASELIEKFPQFAVKNEGVIMAIAKSFPSGLDYGETLVYPSFSNLCDTMIYVAGRVASSCCYIPGCICRPITLDYDSPDHGFLKIAYAILTYPLFLFYSIYLVILMVCFLFLILYFALWKAAYFALWKAASKLVGPIKHIEKKKKERGEGEKVLRLVCDEIDKLEFCGTHHPYYTGPILEAACQNADKVVDEILLRSPKAIECRNKSGYDIIQLAVLHRSDKIYNCVYDIGERKNLYRTIVDSSKNNILHLAGQLAPSHQLNRIPGAALQLQRELQWREEVKNLVFPTYITQENIFKETPDMVFTREHAHLLKEGEQWMKTTAESCSITVALITTIVFAAAITVPGGSNQETGIPLFRKNSAFIVFAISDAISLFASSTALVVFLSILTARFAEKDFLVSLPRRLLIGLCALLVSTTAMMVAFSATLFIVFCDQISWMLAPICGLAFIPISFFVTLQFPLIVDLFLSTYVCIFCKPKRKITKPPIRFTFSRRGTKGA